MSKLTQINPLSDTQVDAICSLIESGAGGNCRTFRVICDGSAVNIATGELDRGNVIHQNHYWDWPKRARGVLLEFMRVNNPGLDIRLRY